MQWTQNGVQQERTLMNGIPKTGYLNSIGFDSGRIYIYAEEGNEVKILRNGVDVTEHLGERGVYDGIECPYIQLDVPAPVDGQATWVITVSRKQTDAGSTANVGDVNQDGSRDGLEVARYSRRTSE